MADEKIVHASAEISVDPNYTTAFLFINAPENGGLDITFDRVMQVINDKRISCGIKEDVIRDAVDNKKYGENFCVAKWEAPVNGTDGRVKYLFSTDRTIKPVEDEHGVVDFKNLGLVCNITKGTTIAEITMPTEGSPGKDIMGRVVTQKRGVAAKISAGKGKEFINGGTELIAGVNGNLKYANGTFSVDEELLINGDVDVSSGNIDFIGSVTIRGSVFEGYKVRSRKSISVNGTVTNAELEAGGDVTVRIGAINSTINCKGNVTLGFCENCNVHSESDVTSASFVGGNVYAGKSIIASGKGVMMGGKYTALENIEANIIGSESYAKTLITLGNNAVLSEEREKLSKSVDEMKGKLEQLEKILTTLAAFAKQGKLSPEREQLKTEAVRGRLKLQREIKMAADRTAEIDAALELNQNLSVSCRKTFYPGVTLRINSSVLQVNAINSCCKAAIDGGEIVFKPL